ncbi:MAG: quinone oxidoreductase [Armatimonadota bacterium]|nr:quinone oxidoreductase [Armatimonadota bacterium]
MKAVRIHAHGGPEVLQYEEVPVPTPGPREVRVKVDAAGLNFLDTYHRTGLYQVSLPFTPGSEAAGVVDAVGPGVDDLRPGDRVAWAMYPGAYAEYAVVPAARLVPVPEGLDAHIAAAVMVQGMTAHYLTHSTYPLRAGRTVLVHAAGGGTGQILVQVCKRLGAVVVGTASSEEKARLAREAGADHVIRYDQEDFVEAVRRITGGRGVDVVYDGVGRATAEKDLDVLQPRGYLVLFGNASGAPPAISPLTLMAKGSLFVTRPSLGHYTATREELLERARAVFGWVHRGEVRVRIARTYPLAAAADAHRALESRQLPGKALLLPP